MNENLGLVLENVTASYRNGTVGLKNASFKVNVGSIAALVGVNGAGKSTVFKSIMGILPCDSGRIRIFGQPVKKALRENIVSYVPQAEDVDWNFPVLVNDLVMMGRYGQMN